ncbi:type II secretion system GspH family protein [Shewanella gelidimarina]|uniref:type II secretion system protein n=1 Tax=Shewanella gelidimarina TaxID=56813 RepID=UPI00200BFF96|nr:type II secretion system protein [Shewanella gelidimarina]MCL1057132.1 type II secretion system GspH family protein [Shewanella gelidimarina]
MHTAHRRRGFTLVELVTTIILIAILSVVVIPRLFTASSYSAFTLREEFIAELRKVQIMAMNNQDRCYRLSVTPTQYQVSRFNTRYNSGCKGTLVRTDTAQSFQGGAALKLDGISSFKVEFDGRGVPSLDCSHSQAKCITVEADETQWIAIESEGYIHAG